MEEVGKNILSYNLYWISKNQWALQAKDYKIYYGTFAEIVKFAIIRFGFELAEIEVAVQEMIKYDHNGAHFGSFKRFLYTFKEDLSDGRKAS